MAPKGVSDLCGGQKRPAGGTLTRGSRLTGRLSSPLGVWTLAWMGLVRATDGRETQHILRFQGAPRGMWGQVGEGIGFISACISPSLIIL